MFTPDPYAHGTRVDIFLEVNNLDEIETATPLELNLHNYEKYRYLGVSSLKTFILTVNDTLIEYEQIKDEKNKSLYFVYTPVFRPGKNTIYLSYNLPITLNLWDAYFEFMLDGGRFWKYSRIKELEIIFFAENAYIYPYKNSLDGFNIIGVGKIIDSGNVNTGGPYYSLNNGYLHGYFIDYDCTENILFRMKQPFGHYWQSVDDMNIPDDFKSETDKNDFAKFWRYSQFIDMTDGYSDPQREFVMALSPERFRIFENTIYAMFGYVFEDPDLQAHFDSIPWYFKNFSVKKEDVRSNYDYRPMFVFLSQLEQDASFQNAGEQF